MNDREELRRLIDVIEKGSGSGNLEQAVDDIKTFANTVSFLANELDTRLKGGDVKAKNKPKSRMGKAIASVPKPNAPPTSAMQLISWAGIWCKPAVLWAFRCPTPAGNTLPITKVAQVTGVDLTNPNVG